MRQMCYLTRAATYKSHANIQDSTRSRQQIICDQREGQFYVPGNRYTGRIRKTCKATILKVWIR